MLAVEHAQASPSNMFAGMIVPVVTVLASLGALANTVNKRDLPAGCNCTGIGCQYGIISDPPQGSLTLFAPNGTNMGNTGGLGYTVRIHQ